MQNCSLRDLSDDSDTVTDTDNTDEDDDESETGLDLTDSDETAESGIDDNECSQGSTSSTTHADPPPPDPSAGIKNLETYLYWKLVSGSVPTNLPTKLETPTRTETIKSVVDAIETCSRDVLCYFLADCYLAYTAERSSDEELMMLSRHWVDQKYRKPIMFSDDEISSIKNATLQDANAICVKIFKRHFLTYLQTTVTMRWKTTRIMLSSADLRKNPIRFQWIFSAEQTNFETNYDNNCGDFLLQIRDYIATLVLSYMKANFSNGETFMSEQFTALRQNTIPKTKLKTFIQSLRKDKTQKATGGLRHLKIRGLFDNHNYNAFRKFFQSISNVATIEGCTYIRIIDPSNYAKGVARTDNWAWFWEIDTSLSTESLKCLRTFFQSSKNNFVFSAVAEQSVNVFRRSRSPAMAKYFKNGVTMSRLRFLGIVYCFRAIHFEFIAAVIQMGRVVSTLLNKNQFLITLPDFSKLDLTPIVRIIEQTPSYLPSVYKFPIVLQACQALFNGDGAPLDKLINDTISANLKNLDFWRNVDSINAVRDEMLQRFQMNLVQEKDTQAKKKGGKRWQRQPKESCTIDLEAGNNGVEMETLESPTQLENLSASISHPMALAFLLAKTISHFSERCKASLATVYERYNILETVILKVQIVATTVFIFDIFSIICDDHMICMHGDPVADLIGQADPVTAQLLKTVTMLDNLELQKWPELWHVTLSGLLAETINVDVNRTEEQQQQKQTPLQLDELMETANELYKTANCIQIRTTSPSIGFPEFLLANRPNNFLAVAPEDGKVFGESSLQAIVMNNN